MLGKLVKYDSENIDIIGIVFLREGDLCVRYIEIDYHDCIDFSVKHWKPII